MGMERLVLGKKQSESSCRTGRVTDGTYRALWRVVPRVWRWIIYRITDLRRKLNVAPTTPVVRMNWSAFHPRRWLNYSAYFTFILPAYLRDYQR